MNAYAFNGVTLPYVGKVAAPKPAKIGSGKTPGRAGGYPGVARSDERKVTLEGTLINGTSYPALLDAWAALSSAHDVLQPAKLYIRDDWYLWALCETINDTERGVESIKYQATYACSDPYYYSDTITNVALAAAGSSYAGTFDVTGYSAAHPLITIAVSAIGGTITVDNITTGESFVLTPTATGTYSIDSRLETVTFAGTDATAQFAGQFPSLAVGSNQVTATPSGTATLSSALVSFSARSL